MGLRLQAIILYNYMGHRFDWFSGIDFVCILNLWDHSYSSMNHGFVYVFFVGCAKENIQYFGQMFEIAFIGSY